MNVLPEDINTWHLHPSGKVHIPPSAKIQDLSTKACECKTAACVDADVKQIEDLMDSIDFKRLSDPAFDGMGGYAHALSCQAQLEQRQRP